MIGPMFGFVLLFLLAVTGQPAPGNAQTATDDLRGVGLIEMAGQSGCTGTLVGADLVLTAGHCLLSRGADGALLAPGLFVFYPTDRSGNPGAAYPARAVAVHPLLLLAGLSDMTRVRHDLGLIRLARPVPASVARPLSIAPAGADTGAAVLVSYRGRGGGARRMRDCPPARADGSALVLRCNVVRGESGAPLVLPLAGRMAVGAVVSSRATTRERQRALAATVAPVYDGLLRALQTGQRR
jgi:protease YdgD